MSKWIDFKSLREQLDFEAVLRFYGVEVNRKGDQHQGVCPLPMHQSKSAKPTFSAELNKGMFQCFGCGAKGNLLDFAVLAEGLDPEKGEDLRTVALKLHEQFLRPQPKSKPIQAELPVPELLKEKSGQLPVVVNAPLDFELKNLDVDHPYLDRQGFTTKTLHHFGVGFCSKGFLVGRVAIPLHNPEGKLLGYAGMSTERRESAENPRYKFPTERIHKGVRYEFNPSLLLYNANRVAGPVKDLVIASDFPAVWWLTQMGYPQVVSPIGALSAAQASIIAGLVAPSGTVWILTEGTDAGTEKAVGLLLALSPFRSTRWVKLEDGKQPIDYPGAFFRERLGK